MLTITVLGTEFYDEENQEFITVGDFDLSLEHSLVSLSKWESIFEKPFLGSDEKTTEETIGYIKAMTLTSDVPDTVYLRLSAENLRDIDAYIGAKRTATWFNEHGNPPRSREVITSELIYYWMFSAHIPIECENWFLGRLFTLIKVFDLKNAKPKPMSRADQMARQREINEQRKRQYGTSG